MNVAWTFGILLETVSGYKIYRELDFPALNLKKPERQSIALRLDILIEYKYACHPPFPSILNSTQYCLSVRSHFALRSTHQIPILEPELYRKAIDQHFQNSHSTLL